MNNTFYTRRTRKVGEIFGTTIATGSFLENDEVLIASERDPHNPYANGVIIWINENGFAASIKITSLIEKE